MIVSFSDTAVKHPDVFVVQVDVDEAVQLALLGEDLSLRIGVFGDKGFQDDADPVAFYGDLGRTTGVLTQDWGNSD